MIRDQTGQVFPFLCCILLLGPLFCLLIGAVNQHNIHAIQRMLTLQKHILEQKMDIEDILLQLQKAKTKAQKQAFMQKLKDFSYQTDGAPLVFSIYYECKSFLCKKGILPLKNVPNKFKKEGICCYQTDHHSGCNWGGCPLSYE